MQTVVDLDGNNVQWRLTGAIARGSRGNKSELHLRARKIIHALYPTFQILEEVKIPLRKTENLFLDFYLPLNRKCIEVHGEQHYKFVPYYHQNMMGFMKHKKRDQEKIEWCEINNIQLIVLPFDKTDTQWENIINDSNN